MRPALLSVWARLALGLGWVALLVLTFGVGERESSLAELEDAVRAGEVSDIVVSGGLSARGRGMATVEVHWREGITRYSATVIEARPRRSAPPPQRLDGADVVAGDVEDRLARLQPGLTFHREDYDPPGVSTSLMGEPVHDGAAMALLGLWGSTLLLLVLSPQPWRATRWAWFWLMWVPVPLGQLAYLLLSGPAPGTSPPRDGKRLTGGQGFLLAVAAGLAANLLIPVLRG